MLRMLFLIRSSKILSRFWANKFHMIWFWFEHFCFTFLLLCESGMWRMFRMRRRQLLTKVTFIDDILSFVVYLLSLSIITLVVRGSRKTSFVLRRLLLSSYIVCLPSSDFVKISRGHKHSTGTVRFTIKRITASNTSRLCMLFTSIGTRSFWIICEKAALVCMFADFCPLQ